MRPHIERIKEDVEFFSASLGLRQTLNMAKREFEDDEAASHVFSYMGNLLDLFWNELSDHNFFYLEPGHAAWLRMPRTNSMNLSCSKGMR
jgi:hypothetical protein